MSTKYNDYANTNYNTSKYRKILEYVPNKKPGIKILDLKQIGNVFPNYESLLSRIEAHREDVPSQWASKSVSNIQYNLMYDNVFSIFGKRGSGKTSAVFTLREIIRVTNEDDIIPPIVIPEMIPEGCSLIGWVLALFEDIINNIDKKQSNLLSKKQGIFSDCRVDRRNSLKYEYEKIKDMYHSNAFNPNHSHSYSDVVLNSERQTQDRFDFSNRLARFWDMLVDAVKEITLLEKGKEFQPLIYIIFDDVDLRPDTVIELFSTIIKYLSHPNLIVMITADEALLLDVVETTMSTRLKKPLEMEMYTNLMGRSLPYFYPRNSLVSQFHNTLRQKVSLMQETPRNYSDKILPPSRRYYLQSYDSFERKAEFIAKVEHIDLEDDSRDVIHNLTNMMEEKVISYYNELGMDHNNNFLFYYEGNGEKHFINAYLAFWGNTSRQIDNEVLIYNDFFDRIIQEHKMLNKSNADEYIRRLHFYMYTFIHDTLIAYGLKPGETNEISRLVDELVLLDIDDWGIYFDYLYLNVYIKEQYNNISNMRNQSIEYEEELYRIFKEGVCLLMLMLFLENLILAEYNSKDGVFKKERTRLHGLGILVDFADEITAKGYSLLSKSFRESPQEFLWFSEKLLDNPSLLHKFDVKSSKSVRSYYQRVKNSEAFSSEKINELSRNNPVWFRTHCQILYLTMNAIYNVQRKNIPMLILFKEKQSILDPFFKNQIDLLRTNLVDTLSEIYKTYSLSNAEKKWGTQFKSKPTSTTDINSLIENNNASDISELMSQINLETKEWKNHYNSFLFKRDLPSRFSTRSSFSSDLLREMQNVCGEILQEFANFSFYRLAKQQEDELKTQVKQWFNYQIIDENEKNAFDNYIKSKRKTLSGKDRDNLNNDAGNIFIPIGLMDKVLRNIEYHLNGAMYYDDNGEKTTTLQESLKFLKSSFSYGLIKYSDAKSAVNVYTLFLYYRDLQEWYYRSLLDEVKKGEGQYIDSEKVPFKNMYFEMEALLQKDDEYVKFFNNDSNMYVSKGERIDKYLVNVIRSNINYAVSSYLSSFFNDEVEDNE